MVGRPLTSSISRLCFFVGLLLAVPSSTSGQRLAHGSVGELVMSNRSAGRDYQPFTRRAMDARIGRLLPTATALMPDRDILQELLLSAPRALSFSIPTDQGEVGLDLVASDRFTDDFKVVLASTGSPLTRLPGLHYMGIVNGDPNTVAAISIFPDQVMGFVNDGQGDHVLGPMEGSIMHIYYPASELPPQSFACDTPEDAPVELEAPQAGGDRSLKCVRFYWEVNHDIFQSKGSVVNTVNYVTALFNQSAVLYANDGISIVLNEVFVWDVPSPYTGTTMLEQLTLFQNHRNAFNGDLAHLLGLSGGGGRAASLSGLCSTDNDDSMCYTGIATSFLSVPTYSWSVFAVTHEQGHLLGSNHTHACVWNGNNTQIDGCGPTAGYPEGGACPIGPIPAGGGTLMSYCHLNAVGINFNNGFGPQPLAVIANSVASAPCLINCTDVACGTVFGLAATGITSTAAVLTWMPANSAVSYDLEWKQIGAPAWNTVFSIAGTSSLLSGLMPWTNYTFRVRTNCASGSSGYTATAGFTTAGNTLSDGLVACYPFNDSPNDASGNGHHGALSGPLPTTDRYGVPNAAYAFDGVDDRIAVTDLNTWAISNEITISFWVKAVESKGNLVVWAWPDIASDRLMVSPHYLHTGSNDFNWTFGTYDGTGNCYVTGYPLYGEWEHYAVTSSAVSNTMKIYKNGVLFDIEQHAGGIADLNRTLYIGGYFLPSFQLHGALDDLAFHRRELTAGEVQQLYFSGTPCSPRVTIAAKVLLEGPYSQATQRMADALRSGGELPASEPYTALGFPLVAGGTGVALSNGVSAVTGDDAICDWVVMELRQAVAPYAVLSTRTALIQRDGDIVGFDGASPITFDLPSGVYHVAVRHRNHLGVMTGAPVQLSNSTTAVIDFRDPSTATFGSNAQHDLGGRMALWCGDTNGNGTVKYVGADNDRDPILVAIGGSTPTNVVSNVYSPLDVNMDGQIRYLGNGNDRDYILTTVGGSTPNNTRTEQLP